MAASKKIQGSTHKEKLFAYAFFNNGGNGTAAAEEAGYAKKSAHVTASRLLNKANVKAILVKLNEKLESKAIITKEKIAQELAKNGFLDIRRAYDENGCLLPIKDLPEDIARSITSIKVSDIFEGTGEERTKTGELVEVKFGNKGSSLAELNKMFGFHAPAKVAATDTDGNDVTAPLSDTQVSKIISELHKKK